MCFSIVLCSYWPIRAADEIDNVKPMLGRPLPMTLLSRFHDASSLYQNQSGRGTSPGSWPKTLPGGLLRQEMPSLKKEQHPLIRTMGKLARIVRVTLKTAKELRNYESSK